MNAQDCFSQNRLSYFQGFLLYFSEKKMLAFGTTEGNLSQVIVLCFTDPIPWNSLLIFLALSLSLPKGLLGWFNSPCGFALQGQSALISCMSISGSYIMGFPHYKSGLQEKKKPHTHKGKKRTCLMKILIRNFVLFFLFIH
jgi:hypothetical protein